MTFTELLIYGAATWRLASLFVQESGPFDIFVWVRERAGIIHDEDKHPIGIPETFFGQLFSGVWGSSVWVAFLGGFVILCFPAWSLKMATVFAFSTVAILIDRFLS